MTRDVAELLERERHECASRALAVLADASCVTAEIIDAVMHAIEYGGEDLRVREMPEDR